MTKRDLNSEIVSGLKEMFPEAIPEWREAMERLAVPLGDHYDFNRLDWCHFCGQISAETNDLRLREMKENMNFRTPARILEVYSYRIRRAISLVTKGVESEPSWVRGKSAEAVARLLVGKPKELADIVYGGREGTPWMEGSRYLGRGPTQVTHLNNYRAVAEEIARQPGGGKFDLVANPELLATDPELGIRAAFADWALKGLSTWARQDRADLVSDKLNTGNIKDSVKPHNLEGRVAATQRAKRIWKRDFSLDGAAVSHETVADPEPEKESERPYIPVTSSDLTKVSRKVRFLVRLRGVIYSVFSAFSFASIMEWLGYIQGVYDGIEHFVKNHAFSLAGTVALVALGSISYLISCTRQDIARGAYVPSGAGGGVDPGPAREGGLGAQEGSGGLLGEARGLSSPVEA